MVVLLFILTVILFLAIDLILTRREQHMRGAASAPSAGVKTRVEPAALISEPYFHPTHTWARVTDDTVTVGVDEFAQKVLGRIQRIDVPKIGSYLRQGDPVWKLFHGTRVLEQSSPVEGEIVDINRSLFAFPDIINRSPYNRGWVLKIKPVALRQNLRNLLYGETARRWLESVRAQFVMRFSTRVGPVCQDGGELVEGAGELLNEAEWEEVLREFFMAEN